MMKPNFMSFALMMAGVLAIGIGSIWHLTLQRHTRLVPVNDQRHGTQQTPQPSLKFAGDPQTTFRFYTTPQMYLFSPEEDGRYKRLCVPEDVCLPIDAVADFIRKEGAKR